jgi:DNA-binding response OmpR family regulator
MARLALVDDDRVFCGTLAEELAGFDHECMIVNDGGRAFETLKKARPELVLLDLTMSDVSGFRLCRMIRSDPVLYGIPVIVLSVVEDEPEMAYCKELGADDYVTKPIVMEKLMQRVHGLLLLNETVNTKDPVTGLPGTEMLKRQVNHLLARGEDIGLCYIGTTGLLGLVTRNLTVTADEIARELAQLIERIALESQIYELVAAHVGAAYFVVVLKADECEKFCRRFVKCFDSELVWRWRGGVPVHGNEVEGDRVHESASRRAPRVSIGGVHNQYRKYANADTMLQILCQVQRKAQQAPTSSYIVCRRQTPRALKISRDVPCASEV